MSQIFSSYGEYMEWVNSKISKDKLFTTTKEYHDSYPHGMKLREREIQEKKLVENQYAKIAMQEVNAKFGDHVEYDMAGFAFVVMNITGVIIQDKYGIPYVKLDSHKRKRVRWHKGFVKIQEIN